MSEKDLCKIFIKHSAFQCMNAQKSREVSRNGISVTQN